MSRDFSTAQRVRRTLRVASQYISGADLSQLCALARQCFTFRAHAPYTLCTGHHFKPAQSLYTELLLHSMIKIIWIQVLVDLLLLLSGPSIKYINYGGGGNKATGMLSALLSWSGM